MKKRVVAMCAAGMIAASGQAALLAGWEVTGVDVKEGAGIETNIAPYAFYATTSDVSTVTSKMLLGAGVNPSTSVNNYGFKISGSDSTDSLADAIAMNHYMEFSFTIDPGYGVNLSSMEMKGEATGTGCSNVVLMTSIDGYVDGAQIAMATNVNATGGFDTDKSGFGAPIDLSASKYQELTGSISFRIYGWGSSTNSGTGETRIRTYESVSDDLVVFGEVVELGASGDLSLSMETSNDWINIAADFDGVPTTNYVLQVSTNLASNVWSTVSSEFDADTNMSFNTTYDVQYYRAIAQ